MNSLHLCTVSSFFLPQYLFWYLCDLEFLSWKSENLQCCYLSKVGSLHFPQISPHKKLEWSFEKYKWKLLAKKGGGDIDSKLSTLSEISVPRGSKPFWAWMSLSRNKRQWRGEDNFESETLKRTTLETERKHCFLFLSPSSKAVSSWQSLVGENSGHRNAQ